MEKEWWEEMLFGIFNNFNHGQMEGGESTIAQKT